jgi:hypothetical protein
MATRGGELTINLLVGGLEYHGIPRVKLFTVEPL